MILIEFEKGLYLRFENKKVILFDLDGTLVDSVPDLASAINRMLETLDRDGFEVSIIRGWVGNGAQMLVKRALSGATLVDEALDPELVSKALETFLGFYAQALCVNTRPYPDVTTTLDTLKSKGYRLAIVTNKPYAFVGPLLEGLSLKRQFELWLGGDSLERRKPDPLPLLHICDALGVAVSECVMVGDSKNDILAAKRAGMQSIGVTYGYNYDEDITVYGPDVTVDGMHDIIDFFGGSE